MESGRCRAIPNSALLALSLSHSWGSPCRCERDRARRALALQKQSAGGRRSCGVVMRRTLDGRPSSSRPGVRPSAPPHPAPPRVDPAARHLGPAAGGAGCRPVSLLALVYLPTRRERLDAKGMKADLGGGRLSEAEVRDWSGPGSGRASLPGRGKPIKMTKATHQAAGPWGGKGRAIPAD